MPYHRALFTTVAAVLAALPLLGDKTAAGFTLGTTDEGALTRWRGEYIALTVDPSVAAIAPVDDVIDAFWSALEDWIEAGELPLFVLAEEGACGAAPYVDGEESTNCVFATAGGAEDVGGTAHVSFLAESGEIVDADISLSTAVGAWSLTAEEGALSLRAVALHETGHLLGVLHSDFEDSVMFPMTSLEGPQKETLAEDDVRAIRALYDVGMLEDYGCSALPRRPRPHLASASPLAAALRY